MATHKNPQIRMHGGFAGGHQVANVSNLFIIKLTNLYRRPGVKSLKPGTDVFESVHMLLDVSAALPAFLQYNRYHGPC